MLCQIKIIVFCRKKKIELKLFFSMTCCWLWCLHTTAQHHNKRRIGKYTELNICCLIGFIHVVHESCVELRWNALCVDCGGFTSPNVAGLSSKNMKRCKYEFEENFHFHKKCCIAYAMCWWKHWKIANWKLTHSEFQFKENNTNIGIQWLFQLQFNVTYQNKPWTVQHGALARDASHMK